MKWSISKVDLKQLRDVISKALFKSHNILRSRSEPQLIANMVSELTIGINSLNISKTFNVRAGGVFVHAQPFVKFSNFPKHSPQSVELGDVLLLRTGLQGGNVVDRRALLLQAKIVDAFPVKRYNKNQHYLYAKWPRFKYERSTKALNDKFRHLTGLDLYNGAKYLLVKNNQHCCSNVAFITDCASPLLRYLGWPCVLTAQPTQPDISHYRCFIGELVEFILGDAGKSYVSPPPKQNRNWDRVIRDLTEITGKQYSGYMKRATSGVSQTRSMALLFLSGVFPESSMLSRAGISLSDKHSEINRPSDIPDSWPRGYDGEGGISIIEFIVESNG